jgi:hypothetical protein
MTREGERGQGMREEDGGTREEGGSTKASPTTLEVGDYFCCCPLGGPDQREDWGARNTVCGEGRGRRRTRGEGGGGWRGKGGHTDKGLTDHTNDSRWEITTDAVAHLVDQISEKTGGTEYGMWGRDRGEGGTREQRGRENKG